MKYMKMALQLAARAKDKTYPNPMVGAVIVKSGRVIGKGCHRRAGEDHAEIRAINNCERGCRGATMYVTLEPCNHYGKTPPCVDAIIANDIKKVVIAMEDPNPATSGKGAERLKKAGIKVEIGVMEDEARDLNRKYLKFMEQKIPYVTVKLAQSLDGKIAARDGSSKWISSGKSRGLVKRHREDYCGIMIGVNTVISDDPFLLDEERNGYDTARIVMDSTLRTPEDSNLFRTIDRAPLVIFTTEKAPGKKVAGYRKKAGLRLIRLKSRNGKVPVRPALKKLAEMGVVNLLVEGGGELVGSFLDRGIVDEIMLFISPKIIGGPYSSVKGKGAANIRRAIELKGMKVTRSGEDILVRGRIS